MFVCDLTCIPPKYRVTSVCTVWAYDEFTCDLFTATGYILNLTCDITVSIVMFYAYVIGADSHDSFICSLIHSINYCFLWVLSRYKMSYFSCIVGLFSWLRMSIYGIYILASMIHSSIKWLTLFFLAKFSLSAFSLLLLSTSDLFSSLKWPISSSNFWKYRIHTSINKHYSSTDERLFTALIYKWGINLILNWTPEEILYKNTSCWIYYFIFPYRINGELGRYNELKFNWCMSQNRKWKQLINCCLSERFHWWQILVF